MKASIIAYLRTYDTESELVVIPPPKKETVYGDSRVKRKIAEHFLRDF